MSYEPGDSLAIFPENDPVLVDALLSSLNFAGDERIAAPSGYVCDIRSVLLKEVTVTKPSRRLREAIKGASHSGTGDEPPNQLDILELLETAPQFRHQVNPQEFVDLLMKLQPRLYSFASSMRVQGEVAQIFVSTVEYNSGKHLRKGVCSGYLAERIQPSSVISVFVHAAPHFRLPTNPDDAVIMIGAGTGVAPFRAFLEERSALKCRGANWLFYGQTHEATGYYYREDWLSFLRHGVLTHLDTAFSRDQATPIYVQHRMVERASELWGWLAQGAHIYLCGDAATLAPEVDATLEEIACHTGRLPASEAAAFVNTLHAAKRYHRDVY